MSPNSARLPEVGETFVWMNATFVRTDGRIEEGLFPVRYVDATGANVDLIGKPV